MRAHRDEADINRLSAQLVPPEEKNVTALQEASGKSDEGELVCETDQMKMPSGFEEDERPSNLLLRLDPVIIVILILAIAFIVFITYLVYLTPTPAN